MGKQNCPPFVLDFENLTVTPKNLVGNRRGDNYLVYR